MDDNQSEDSMELFPMIKLPDATWETVLENAFTMEPLLAGEPVYTDDIVPEFFGSEGEELDFGDTTDEDDEFDPESADTEDTLADDDWHFESDPSEDVDLISHDDSGISSDSDGLDDELDLGLDFDSDF